MNSLSIRKIASLKNWYKLILFIQVNDSVMHRKAVLMQPSSIPEICEGADFVPKAFICNFLISLQEHKEHITLMSVKKSSQCQGFNRCSCVCALLPGAAWVCTLFAGPGHCLPALHKSYSLLSSHLDSISCISSETQHRCSSGESHSWDHYK